MFFSIIIFDRVTTLLPIMSLQFFSMSSSASPLMLSTHSESFYFLTQIKFWFNIILSPIGMILNGILFYLIKNYSSPNLVAYKKVLYLGCVTDFFFAFWDIFVQPDMVTIGSVYFVFTEGILGNLQSPWSAASLPISLFFLYLSVVNVAVQFIYRYLLVCWKITLNKWFFGLLFGIGVFVICVYCSFYYRHIIFRSQTDADYARLLNGTDWASFAETTRFGAFYVPSFIGSFSIAYSIVVVSYAAVFFCGFKIFFGMNNKNIPEFSDGMQKYQKQISIVMSVEALVPFITVALPVLLDITTIVLDVNLSWAGKIAFFLGALATFVNPIVKLSVISCYRKKILQIILFRRSQVSHLTPPSPSVTTFPLKIV